MNGSPMSLVLRINTEGKGPEVAAGERTTAHNNSNASAPARHQTIRVPYSASNGQIRLVWYIAWYKPSNSNILSFIFST